MLITSPTTTTITLTKLSKTIVVFNDILMSRKMSVDFGLKLINLIKNVGLWICMKLYVYMCVCVYKFMCVPVCLCVAR